MIKYCMEIVAKIGQPIWLGAAIFGTSKNYENVDLSPFDYTNWQNGTRPAYKRSKKCVKISSQNQEWFSDCCYYRPVPYICKKLAGKMGRPYWITATNKTNNINPKFANKKGNTVMKQQEMKKEASDTVLPFLTKTYGSKNDIRKIN
uniref:C-type lectin domain-containing protein n=1 Tax=Onchocerca volvulus TaxID=6282 RepID=A0A8R1XMT1_ONCVO